MSPRSAMRLAALALLLGALVYLLEARVVPEQLDREDAARALFPGIAPSDVLGIRLHTPDGHDARLERRGGRWQGVEPTAFAADTVAIDGMASTIAQLVFEEEIVGPAGRGVYGLDDEAGRVVVETEGGDAELWIGSGAPGGGRSYVATSGSDDARVFVVPTWRVTSLRKSLDELRDRRILPFDRGAVDEVEVRWPGGRVVAVRRHDAANVLEDRSDPADRWRLAAPVVGPADSDTIEDLLSDLAFLRADGFEDAPSPEAIASLTEPDFDVFLRGRAGAGGAAGEEPGEEDGAVAPFEARFTLGGFATRRLRYARGPHPDTLYLLPAERLAEFPRSVAAYRSRELTRFEAERVGRVEIAFRGDPIQPERSDASEASGEARVLRVERAGDGWVLDGEPLDAVAVAALVDELALLEASRIVAEEMGPDERAALGLAPARIRIQVHDADSTHGEPRLLADLLLGRSDPARGTFAMRPGSSLVYALDRDLAARLPNDPDRFLAAHRPPAQGAPAD